jgi:hypothetical protein
MTNQERLALADRVQKDIQKKFIQFRIVRRQEQIEREFKCTNEARKN